MMERKAAGRCLAPEDRAWLFPLLMSSAGNLPSGGPPAWRANRRTADALGFAWVGPGAIQSRSRNVWHDPNYQRFYRPPGHKGRNQANLEYQPGHRAAPTASNAHIDIDETCP